MATITVLSDQHLMVLLGISRHQSIREIAAIIGRAVGTVQQRLHDLEEAGLISKSVARKARNRYLTSSGQALLQQRRLG
jgi:predicted transcriptional regulator